MTSNSPAAPLRTGPSSGLAYPPTYESLRPFFDPGTQWCNVSQEHLAYRTLKDLFPALSAQESFLIVITARQLFR
ncbi:hypothetical protein DIC66_20565 [Rhodoferax lacus]|uniref:Uncharacterized protein n=1 Tax=Rhodoferax lacus TaxID=2184758 RepID=A0A3E1R6R6_9BURK|nr:hypothetical protein [Rhodoferax lacus]RFO95056.1 hypothetical protein DIC66_20565 [Rhodoferax lacus]